MRLLLALAFALSVVVVCVPAPARAAGAEKLPMKASKGDSLTTEQENAVKGVLFDYLSSLKARDFLRAGGHIDEASFRALADTMVLAAAGDTLPLDGVRQTIFGVPSREALLAKPVPELFATLVAASEAANPGAFGAVADAVIDVLAVRRVDEHVVVAYQLTIPGAGPEGQAVTHVTAETLRATPKGWKIVFRR